MTCLACHTVGPGRRSRYHRVAGRLHVMRILGFGCAVPFAAAMTVSHGRCSGPDHPGGHTADGGAAIPGLQKIEVKPGQTTLTIDNGVAAQQPYTAVGTFKDGSSRDITDSVSWSISDPALG